MQRVEAVASWVVFDEVVPHNLQQGSHQPLLYKGETADIIPIHRQHGYLKREEKKGERKRKNVKGKGRYRKDKRKMDNNTVLKLNKRCGGGGVQKKEK
jgi:hypothetical protein